MCTVVAIKRAGSECPLVVAANRDEFYARASTPVRRVAESPAVVAGVDLVKGGTWMGASARGIFVALTNQRQHEGADGAKASRGEVVMDALSMPDVEAIDELLRGVDARAYNGFNLLYGDAASLRVAYGRADRAAIEIEALEDGIWVLPNDRLGSPDFPKAERARELVEPLVERPFSELATGLHGALADHERPPLEEIPPPPPGSLFTRETLRVLQSICVHTPVYGTRSSTLLALRHGSVHYYGYADGPPCEVAFRDETELLR